MMEYHCGKFGDCSFSHFGFIMWTDRQTDRQTDRETHRQTDADECFTCATVISVINKRQNV